MGAQESDKKYLEDPQYDEIEDADGPLNFEETENDNI
jgi:hypothetical protein